MEDQGIMALPQAGMQAPTAQPSQGFDPATAAAFEQMRSQVSPKEFSSEMLSAAEQADPAAVQQLRQALSGLRLPQEVIDAMQQMVEIILRDPQNYAAIRQEMLSDGVPEDLLPEQFDPMFFGALRVALDQIEAEVGGQPVQAFAEGGIASLRPIAQAMQSMGRGQDTMLAHINPQEARVLQMMGGIGTINPRTGLREYGLFKSIGNAIKSVGKAVSGAVKGVVNAVKDFAKSSVGKIVTSVALGFFLGPAAAGLLGVSSVAGVAAVSGFVGGFGSSILAGNSFKDSLKNGAIGGVTAGATAGITGGMGAFEAGSYAGPTTVAGQWDKAINSGKSLLGISTSEAGATTVGGTSVDPFAELDVRAGTAPNVPTVEELVKVPSADLTAGQQALSYDGSGIGQPTTNLAAVQSPVVSDAPSSLIPQNVPVEPVYQQTAGEFVLANEPRPFITGPELGADRLAGAPSGMNFQTFEPSYDSLTRPGINMGDAAINQATPAAQGLTPEQIIPPARGPVALGPEPKSFFQKTVDFFNPNSGMPGPTAIEDRAFALQQKFPGLSAEAALKQAATDVAQNTPGMISRYAPITGAALGAAYLGGAFTPEQPGSPGVAPKETGTDLLRAQPGVYGTTPGGANVTYASLPSGYNYSPMQMLYRPQVTMGNPYGQRRMFAEGGIAAVAPAKYNLGGYASGGIGSMAKKYPRRTGQISGPGTGTSDDIPAMLSDGEFVMTAKAVRGAGKGSRREGAKRMYAMMRKFEGKA